VSEISIKKIKQTVPQYHSYTTQNSRLAEYNKRYKIYNRDIEDFIENLGVKIEHSKRQDAIYSFGEDVIKLPFKSKFKRLIAVTREQNYYSTLFHELAHWTGNKKRLRRKSLVKYCRDMDRGEIGTSLEVLEEITAELTANLLMEYFGLQKTPSYLSLCFINKELSYLDKPVQEQLYIKATRQATRASNFIIKCHREYVKKE
jgi:antirestriction protein ArdC